VKAKASLEERRARLNAAREDPSSPASVQLLREGLADRASIVVARAAQVAGELNLAALAPDLVSAFERFLVDPTKTDKGCLAKTAILEALNRLEYAGAEAFLKGIRHVQREPVWGGSEDTAAQLRGEAAIGLARIAHPEALTLLVDLLVDPERPARMAAARALAYLGRGEGALLLRLKILQGDREPEVMAECFSGLLSLSPSEAIPFVGRFLGWDDPAIAESAALALGETRRPAALELLKDRWETSTDSAFRQVLLVAIASLRISAAADFLLSLIREGSKDSARKAISALRPFLYQDSFREQVAGAVEERADPLLADALSKALQGT